MKTTRITQFLAASAYFAVTAFTAYLMLEGRPVYNAYLPSLVSASVPNFAVTSLCPALLILAKKKYHYVEYLRFIGSTFMAMVLYEIVQIWMPRRTYDWNDIFASFLGAIVASVAGLVVPFPFLNPYKTVQKISIDSYR